MPEVFSDVAKDWRVAAHEPRKPGFVFVGVAILLGLAVRLDLLIANNFVIDSDEAIVGLMARDVALGKDWPIFYYGQHYMGSFEALLVAACFKLFGISNLALKAVPLIFSLALIGLTYFIARRVCSEWGARAASLLMALPASPLIVWSSMARGGFVEVIFIGALATLLALIWLENTKPSLVETALIGSVLGFGWWVNNQIIYFILPIGLFMLLHCLRNPGISSSFLGKGMFLMAHFAAGVAAFILGGFPFWAYNLEHDFKSFEMFGAAEHTDIYSHIEGFFSLALPIILGAKRFWNSDEVFPGALLLSYLLYSLLAVVMFVFRGAAIWRLITLKSKRCAPFEIFPVLLITTCIVFIFSSFGWLVQAPRYLLPLYLPLYVIAGGALGGIHARSKFIAHCLLTVLLALNISSQYLGGRAIPGEPHVFEGQRVSKDHTELINWLRSKSISVVRTNYWIGYRLAFETNESVKFLVFGEPHRERIVWPELQPLRDEGALLPHVLVDKEAQIVRQALNALGIGFKQAQVSGYTVIYDLFDQTGVLDSIGIEELRKSAVIEASHSPDTAHLAIDGLLSTRWGSAEAQSPGMSFTIRFKQTMNLRGMSYSLGSWWHDYPRGLEISMQLADDSRVVLLREGDWSSIRYYLGSTESVKLDFAAISGLPGKTTFAVKEIRLVQTGSDPVFDWSIAELGFLR